MKEVYRKITVDLSRRSNSRMIFARQNDIGARNLNICLTDDGLPYEVGPDCSAAIVYLRPDKVAGAIDGTVLEDGTVGVELSQTMISCVGEVACSVSLFDRVGNKLSSSDFYIDVVEAYYSGDTLADSPEYDLLTDIFNKVAVYQDAEKNRASAEAGRVAAEEERAENELLRDAKINDMLGVSGEVVLKSSAWSSKLEQSFTVSGLRETDLAAFYPSAYSDKNALDIFGVFIIPDTSGGTVYAVANEKPTVDISLRYFITRGRVPEVGEV